MILQVEGKGAAEWKQENAGSLNRDESLHLDLSLGQTAGTNPPSHTVLQHSMRVAERTVGPTHVLRVGMRDVPQQ